MPVPLPSPGISRERLRGGNSLACPLAIFGERMMPGHGLLSLPFLFPRNLLLCYVTTGPKTDHQLPFRNSRRQKQPEEQRPLTAARTWEPGGRESGFRFFKENKGGLDGPSHASEIVPSGVGETKSLSLHGTVGATLGTSVLQRPPNRRK